MELSSRHLELDIRTAATAYCVQRNFRTGLSSLVHVNFPFRINEAEALLILKHFLQILNLFWWSAGLRDLLYLGGDCTLHPLRSFLELIGIPTANQHRGVSLKQPQEPSPCFMDIGAIQNRQYRRLQMLKLLVKEN